MTTQQDNISIILDFIKETENLYINKDIDKKQKKEYCLTQIKTTLPDFYKEHEELIIVLIDTLILISNNPEILKVVKKNCLNCCV